AIATNGAAWLDRRRRFEGDQTFDTIPADVSGVPAPPRRSVATGNRAADAAAGGQGATPALPTATLALAPQFAGGLCEHAGDGSELASNEFVVGAGRTASGEPILANDPHLHLTAPGPFHVVHLVVPGVLDAVGAALPGLPAIVSGRNDRCAWGVTSLGASLTDVYADTLSDDGRRVRVPGGWAPVRTAPFDLHWRVLGLELPIPALVQRRRWTPHGAVVIWDPRRHLALAARWSATEDDRITLARLVGVERSRTAGELAGRWRSLVTPAINVVAADVDGATIYQSTGLVPERPFPFARGVLPSDGRHEWAGFVPADSMPAWNVPRERFAVNGNNRPSAAGAWIRYEFQQDRAARMADRLARAPKLTLTGAASVQNDVYSRSGERTTPWLVACADSLRSTLDSPELAALDTLRAWDFVASRNRVAPTLNRTWITLLQERSRTTGLPGLTLAGLSGRAPDAFRAPGGESPERPAVAACTALRLALDSLAAKLGPDLATWTWGRAHRARFEHALTTAFHEPSWEPDRVPVDGDGSTVCVGGSTSPHSFDVEHGPAFRHVVDLAIADSSLGVVPPYNSAAAPVDLSHAWADHAYVPLLRNPARIAAVTVDRLTLRP
ncbi:MAG TPA: penicillin acylase family protein, partial [Candidatus Acidoferrales bacterium]|nr:penicillin acylase family protein [Candidatus Acidoferrales bacterium]